MRLDCINEGCFYPVENKSTGECASCGRARRKAEAAELKPKKELRPIKKTTSKMDAILREYSVNRKMFLIGKKCAVFPDQEATQVHHMKGKIGFADDYAREQMIPLWLDERFWLPVSTKGHWEIETNPDWAKEKGYSLNRL